MSEGSDPPSEAHDAEAAEDEPADQEEPGEDADAEAVAALPTGPHTACLDAMILLLFHDNGHLAELAALFPEGAYTADVVMDQEIGGTPALETKNADIINAQWLKTAPVLAGTDAQLVSSILSAWGSPAGKDRGEAEIVVLCQRHGWIAITDDRGGRGELEQRGLEFSYMVSMLAFAAASGHAGMDVETAWRLSQEVQQDRAKPFLESEAHFRTIVKMAKRVWDGAGQPGWPEMLADWRIDALVDKADKRPASRAPRKITAASNS